MVKIVLNETEGDINSIKILFKLSLRKNVLNISIPCVEILKLLRNSFYTVTIFFIYKIISISIEVVDIIFRHSLLHS